MLMAKNGFFSNESAFTQHKQNKTSGMLGKSG